MEELCVNTSVKISHQNVPRIKNLLTSHWCRQQCRASVSEEMSTWWATGRRDKWWSTQARRGLANHSSSTARCHAAGRMSLRPCSPDEDPSINDTHNNFCTHTFRGTDHIILHSVKHDWQSV